MLDTNWKSLDFKGLKVKSGLTSGDKWFGSLKFTRFVVGHPGCDEEARRISKSERIGADGEPANLVDVS